MPLLTRAEVAKGAQRRPKKASFQPASSPIPAPFEKAPDSLESFLQRLDPAHVYISHIDRHPIDKKKSIFTIPVLLNGAIAALLAWRIWAAYPTYWAIFQSLLGYATSATVDTARTTRNEQIWLLFKRTMMFAVDFLVFRFIAVWPLTFFLEQPANPVSWRWKVGFRKEEIIVRMSRNWDTEDLMQGVKQGEENPFFKTRILPAISRDHMRKTGYLMMDRSWDLDFELMQDAHVLLKQDKLKLAELDKLVFAHQECTGWVVWKWEPEDKNVEDRREKVVAFKDKLTAMGKESLFWKWTEIVEQEREKDGGFTPERQQKVAQRVQQEFERNGVNFEEVMKSVGGLDELPAKGD